MKVYTTQDLIDKDYITDVDLASSLKKGTAVIEGGGSPEGIERVELICTVTESGLEKITLKDDETPLTYSQIKALVDDASKFVTLRYMDMWWMLPAYDDGGAIMFTSSTITGGLAQITRVVINTDNQMSNYTILLEDADHKTDDLSKETALDGHDTYPTTKAVNTNFIKRGEEVVVSTDNSCVGVDFDDDDVTDTYIEFTDDTIELVTQKEEGSIVIPRSVSSGTGTATYGNYSHAEGENTTAEGYGSHAEGQDTNANNDYSHTEGCATYTMEDGAYSHAEGLRTHTGNEGAHSEGEDTEAAGYASHAEGYKTVTNTDFGHAQGRWNSYVEFENDIAPFMHGCGTSNSDRKNAFAIAEDGKIYVIGLGGYDGTNHADALSLQELFGTSNIKTSSNKNIQVGSNVYPIPDLTVEQVTAAYNAVVAGRAVTITDATDKFHLGVTQADTLGEDLAISIIYLNVMLLTYEIVNNQVEVQFKEL